MDAIQNTIKENKNIKICDIKNCFQLIFENTEGITLCVTPPNVYGNYNNNNWIITSSGGYILQFKTGDDALKWLRENDYYKINK